MRLVILSLLFFIYSNILYAAELGCKSFKFLAGANGQFPLDICLTSAFAGDNGETVHTSWQFTCNDDNTKVIAEYYDGSECSGTATNTQDWQKNPDLFDCTSGECPRAEVRIYETDTNCQKTNYFTETFLTIDTCGRWLQFCLNGGCTTTYGQFKCVNNDAGALEVNMETYISVHNKNEAPNTCSTTDNPTTNTVFVPAGCQQKANKDVYNEVTFCSGAAEKYLMSLLMIIALVICI
eukprot:402910_1